MSKEYKILPMQKLNWERILINDYVDFTYKPIGKMFKIIRKSTDMNESLITTQKYQDFDGRIITKEVLLINDESFEVMAQWDTGAIYSSISRELVNKLGIILEGKYKVDSTNHSQILDSCNILMLINDTIAFPVKAMVVDNIHNTGIDLLIGMDIISQGDFVISTYEGTTCFSFRVPSKGLIDFSNE